MVRREGAFDGATCVSLFSTMSEGAGDGTPRLTICNGATQCCADKSCYKETVDWCRAGMSPFTPLIMTTSRR